MKVAVQDVIYRVRGTELRRALDSLDISQNEFARECGYTGPAHVSRLTKERTLLLKESSPIVQTLKKHGVELVSIG